MTTSLCTDDLFSVLNGHDKLISDFAYLVTRAEEQLSRLRELDVTSAAKESPVTPPHLLDPPAPVDLLTPAEVGMNESVCDFINSVSFADLSVAEILEQFSIVRRGSCGRYTRYFGSRPYTYGRNISHEPQDYPRCELFSYLTIFSPN